MVIVLGFHVDFMLMSLGFANNNRDSFGGMIGMMGLAGFFRKGVIKQV